MVLEKEFNTLTQQKRTDHTDGDHDADGLKCVCPCCGKVGSHRHLEDYPAARQDL
jgi:hypothetical protein